MSLNRSEQLLFDYMQKHPEERQYWLAKVQAVAARTTDEHGAATTLEAELWRYFEERSRVAQPFKDNARRDGISRTSMRNLAEYLLRVWTEPRPKRPQLEGVEPE